jgi:hypothetical protein
LLGLCAYKEVSATSLNEDRFAVLVDEGIPSQMLSCGQGMPICCQIALALEAHIDGGPGWFVNHERVNAAHNPNP